MGRPESVVPSAHVRELERRKKAREQAEREAAAALEALDQAMAAAFQAGVPILKIAETVGTTRQTVYTALKRQGAMQ